MDWRKTQSSIAYRMSCMYTEMYSHLLNVGISFVSILENLQWFIFLIYISKYKKKNVLIWYSIIRGTVTRSSENESKRGEINTKSFAKSNYVK